jgi:heme-degrading monooxygenase HmoA
MSTDAQYVIVWEFRVRPEKEKEFVEQYGPEGSWAQLFRRSGGYIRTELTRDVTDHLRFLTLDYWQTEEEFNDFRERHLAEYQRLDKEFEGLTEKETHLGAFYRAAKQNRLKASG